MFVSRRQHIVSPRRTFDSPLTLLFSASWRESEKPCLPPPLDESLSSHFALARSARRRITYFGVKHYLLAPSRQAAGKLLPCATTCTRTDSGYRDTDRIGRRLARPRPGKEGLLLMNETTVRTCRGLYFMGHLPVSFAP